MFYVARDGAGKICDVQAVICGAAREPMPADDPEVLQFIHERWRQSELNALDRDFVRAIEDTIELLIAKGVILFTDLPPKVQEKMLRRKKVRGLTHYAGNFAEPEGDIIPI